MGPMLYLPYVRTTTYLRRKTAQTQRAITSRTTKIAQSLDKIKYNTLTTHARHCLERSFIHKIMNNYQIISIRNENKFKKEKVKF